MHSVPKVPRDNGELDELLEELVPELEVRANGEMRTVVSHDGQWELEIWRGSVRGWWACSTVGGVSREHFRWPLVIDLARELTRVLMSGDVDPVEGLRKRAAQWRACAEQQELDEAKQAAERVDDARQALWERNTEGGDDGES